MKSLVPPSLRLNRVVLAFGIAFLATIFASVIFVDANSTAAPMLDQNFVVTNNNDSGLGSLRDAITNANATVGKDTISFDIPGSGIKVITLLTSLPDITDAVVIDGSTQPGYAGSPLIELDGLQTGKSGLVIKAGGSTVKGLAIGNFNEFGIWLNNCDNNVIQGNYIGINAAGTVARVNDTNLLLSNSSNNLIGGTTAAARNVISASRFAGLDIGGSNNVIQGNFIGTNAAGTAKFENTTGISISSSPFINNVIGGTAPGAGNLISGNTRGILVSAPGTIIQGNLIGTDITGTQPIPNSEGINSSASNVLIGGTTASARNIISGNLATGVTFGGTGSKLQGNYIGTDITGSLALPNALGVNASNNALVGGTTPEERNVISANQNANVSLNSNAVGNGVTLQGNYVGTDVTGTRALGNSRIGVSVSGFSHLVGGTAPGAGNVISGNETGIQLAATGNTIQGNLIGLNAAGTLPLPNTEEGISLAFGNNIVGGIQNGAANKIAFNGGPGVTVLFGTGNSIRGNSIFANGELGIDLGQTGVTPNDATDSDSGPNNLQNFPVLTSVQSNGGNTTIQGTLKSTPNTTFQIDFYSNSAIDPSGNGEGALFFNTAPVNTNANGDATINVTFPAPLAAGRVITATATDPNGNTSEFSAGDPTNANGIAQFSVSSISVIEDLPLLTVTVVRTGGSAGNLSVDYATANGTAIAGQDYTATSGTLNFANGETSKTFQIPILDDSTTELEETFTVVLHTASLDMLGTPNVLTVTLQDHLTVPFMFPFDASVQEGNSGTKDMLFLLNLSVPTGKTVSVNYATANGTAIGGAACGSPSVDYESKSGTITFAPGQTSFTLPIKICGDTSAEANEQFVVQLSNPVNVELSFSQGSGLIFNDDLLGLILEDNGPGVSQAMALESLLLTRDPFKVLRIPHLVDVPDNNTRVLLFATGLQLDPSETAAAVTVRFIGSNSQIFDVLAEDVRAVPGTDFTQVVVKLPETLPAGTCNLTVRAHGRVSNLGTIRIVQ